MKYKNQIYSVFFIAACALTISSVTALKGPGKFSFDKNTYIKMTKDEIKNSFTSLDHRDAFVDWVETMQNFDKFSEIEKARIDLMDEKFDEDKFLKAHPGIDRNNLASLNVLKAQFESSPEKLKEEQAAAAAEKTKLDESEKELQALQTKLTSLNRNIRAMKRRLGEEYKTDPKYKAKNSELRRTKKIIAEKAGQHAAQVQAHQEAVNRVNKLQQEASKNSENLKIVQKLIEFAEKSAPRSRE